MEVEKIEPKYVMKLETIDSNSIEEYHVYEEERRMIRWGKVKQMVTQFSDKDVKERHFDSPIVVNENGKKRVIDGNHRIEAIREKIARNPEFSIKLWVATYRELNRDQERKIYTKWNSGTPENSIDFLKWHFETIPYGKEMLKRLPVSIYGSDSSLKLKDLVGAHIYAKRKNKFSGGYSAGGEKTVSDFKKIELEDIKTIAAFCKDMEEIFGKYHKGSPYYRSTPLQSFYKIWYDNQTNVNRDEFIKAFKAVFLERWSEVNELSGHGGRSASITFYHLSLERLNNYRKRIHFLSDKEVLEE